MNIIEIVISHHIQGVFAVLDLISSGSSWAR